MKVLFIGGTGVISSASAPWAIAQGIDLYLLNRGQSVRSMPEGATHLKANVQNADEVDAAIGQHEFDAVVNWIAFEPTDVIRDIERFQNRTGQYVFISSASVYQLPVSNLPITESVPLVNSYWRYSQQKIACEDVLMQAYRERNFPATIVRPAHTYDKTLIPVTGGFTTMERLRRGKHALIPGDGTSLWTLTHHEDFARGFVGLLGHPQALGEAVHITSEEALTWNHIFSLLAQAFGYTEQFLHVPSDLVHAHDTNLGVTLLGDMTSSKTFDNSKIKRLVPSYHAVIPFHRGVEEIARFYRNNPGYQSLNHELDGTMDRIAEAQLSAWPSEVANS